jgi:hypothetical protein
MVRLLKKTGLFVVLLLGTGSVTLGQHIRLEQPVTITFRQLKADSALQLLQSKTGLNMTYNARFLPGNQRLNAQFEKVPLSIILDSIFQNPLLHYKIMSRQLVVFRLPQKDADQSRLLPAFKYFSGKITDARTGTPLPYASVSVLHEALGVITNKAGFFVIQIPDTHNNDTLIISHMGYYRQEIPVATLIGFQSIALHEKSVSLPEIFIRSTTAVNLVQKAIARLPANFYTASFMLRGFYREIIKKNKKYLSYTEALLDIYKRPLRPTLFHDQIKVLRMRKYSNFSHQDSVMFKLKGGLDAVLHLDVARNRPGFLEANQMSHYTYGFEDFTSLNNHLVYVVSFKPRSEEALPAYEGELYIDASSLAIVQVRFHYDRKALRKMNVQYVLKSSRRTRAFPVRAEYRVSYQLFNGKYFIHHILGDIRFSVQQKQRWLRSIFDVSFEIMTTDINSSHPARFANSETVKTNKVFSDFISEYDFPFWKTANIMVPEDNIIKALQHFKEKELQMEPR